MGGKYEIIGCCYPCSDGCYDLHEYTDSWFKARKIYRKAKKMFYSAFIIRNDKNKNIIYNEMNGKLEKQKD